MIWFFIGFTAGYALIAALIMYEFQEYLLDVNRPAPKSKPWGKL